MSKKKSSALSLGDTQDQIVEAAAEFEAAKTAKTETDQAYEEAMRQYIQVQAKFIQAVQKVYEATAVRALGD